MLGRLAGVVAEVSEEDALIAELGVGYVVRCGSRTLSRLAQVGEDATIHVESQWSESAGPRLYGFLSRVARPARDYYRILPAQIIEIGLPVQL